MVVDTVTGTGYRADKLVEEVNKIVSYILKL